MKFDKISRGLGLTQSRFFGLGKHARRITAQEYIPFAAWILSWAAFTAAIGLPSAILLMAANGFIQAIRSLFLVQSFDAISARLECASDLRARARRLALHVDIAVLLGCIALLLPFTIGLQAIGLAELATMMLIMALGLPARTPAVLVLDRRNIGTAWRMGSALALAAGAGMVLLFDLNWAWGALALAMREWGGLFAVWLVRGSNPQASADLPSDLEFAELASRTSIAARRRLIYRTCKVVLSVLGPVGSILARTGRGSGLDGRLAQRLSINPIYVGLLAMVSSAAAVAAVVVSRDPPALLVASVMARISAASISVLIWWRWGMTTDEFPEWLNEDL